MLIHGNGKQLPTEIDPKNNICLVVTHEDGSKDWWYGSNKVTDDGDIYYAKKSASETPATSHPEPGSPFQSPSQSKITYSEPGRTGEEGSIP